MNATEKEAFREANREQIKRQLLSALESIPKGLKLDRLAEKTGEPEESLREKSTKLLREMLGNFPNQVGSGYGPWRLNLLRRGHGTYSVEIGYQLASASALVFDMEKVTAAGEAGLFDELGNPVFPPPCCPECLHPNDAFDFLAHLARQRAFSEKTFGPGERTQGVCDHIRKELGEIEKAPLDLEEWIDVVILALDGAWRCGGTPEQILATLQAKQAKNEARQWPDWRTADPNKAITHVKADSEEGT